MRGVSNKFSEWMAIDPENATRAINQLGGNDDQFDYDVFRNGLWEFTLVGCALETACGAHNVDDQKIEHLKTLYRQFCEHFRPIAVAEQTCKKSDVLIALRCALSIAMNISITTEKLDEIACALEKAHQSFIAKNPPRLVTERDNEVIAFALKKLVALPNTKKSQLIRDVLKSGIRNLPGTERQVGRILDKIPQIKARRKNANNPTQAG
jgi:hypothetical protein